MMKKSIKLLISVIMVFTMMLSTGSVFANGETQPLGNLQRIVPSRSYVQIQENSRTHVTIDAMYENGYTAFINKSCTWTVDHNEIITVNDGVIDANQKGVATITVRYFDTQTQITVEVV